MYLTQRDPGLSPRVGMKRRARQPRDADQLLREAKAEARKLPPIDEFVVDALCHMLQTDRNMPKPPVQAARLLALCVELHKLRLPFPHRRVAAQALGGGKSVWTLDAAISTRVDQGYLTEVHETTTGNVANRDSVIRQRFFIPHSRVIEIAEQARARRK
jgi:hypothetical protein